MKSKKTHMTILCYFMLVAFTGMICTGLTNGSERYSQKVQVTPVQKNLNTDMNFLFEEENDSEILLGATFLLQPWTLFSILIMVAAQGLCYSFVRAGFMVASNKTPLFISIRTLRL